MSRTDMRLLEVYTLTVAARDRVCEVLAERGLDYVVSDRTDREDPSAVVSVPVPAASVDDIHGRVDALDLDDRFYTVVVDPETVLPSRLEDANDSYEVESVTRQGIAQRELRAKADGLLPDFTNHALLTAISTVVATAGVLAESISVLVGAMVIAPLIGPPMATSLATVIDDTDLFVRGLRYQAVGLGIGLASAVAFALFVRLTTVVQPVDVAGALGMSNHTVPAFLLLVVALGAGVAGALSLSTTGTIDLVGVMIAAAVVPPVGVVGVGIAYGDPVTVVGSAAVVLVNVLCINLAAIVCLWYLGYHPDDWADLNSVRTSMLVTVLALAAGIAVLGALLASLATGTPAWLSTVAPSPGTELLGVVR